MRPENTIDEYLGLVIFCEKKDEGHRIAVVLRECVCLFITLGT
jgi:hypothetical protein